ncbi:ZYX protein, partial [Amia calva]|nr:ZYX protein [Amia calva]
MSDSSKPVLVSSTLSLTVSAPSFYNAPKRFASVAPPRPKSPNASSGQSVASTAVIGRVGEMPPPPPSVAEGSDVLKCCSLIGWSPHVTYNVLWCSILYVYTCTELLPPSPLNRPSRFSTSKVTPGSGSGSGSGVPLSLREVEELEKLTQGFIKDMENAAPLPSTHTELCGQCGQPLSRCSPAVSALNMLFHSECFVCAACQRPLQGMHFYQRAERPHCEDCYNASLEQCSECGERITDKVLKAVGRCFHANCFRCTHCGCSLEGAPFITDDDNNAYCVPDYHRRFSPQCVSCGEPIVPDPGREETIRVVALEKNFHLKCYRCEDCSRPLSIQADTEGCYPLEGRILCLKCHTHRAKQAAH